MKIINDINEELKSLTFYYNKDSFVSSDGNTENAQGNIEDFVRFCNSIHSKNRFLTVDEQKASLPSHFLTLKRSEWDIDCCFLFVDIDSTVGVERFINESDSFFKTFKNVVYLQKSISGKLHICIYSRKESIRNRLWDVPVWKTGWVFWNGYINEWFKAVYNIDYSEMSVNSKGDKALDNHMYNISQPLKMSCNDIIVNPYFSIRSTAYNFNYDDDANEIIKGKGITTVRLIEIYREKLKCRKQVIDNQTIIAADRYECNVGQYTDDLEINNNSRVQMCFALKRAGFSNEDIMQLMYERTTSAHAKNGKSKKEWNRHRVEHAIAQSNTYSDTNPGVFNTWANIGTGLLKKINVHIDAIYDKKEALNELVDDNSQTIQLADTEYISDNNIQTITDGFDKSEHHNVIISAPTGTGKSVSTVKVADAFAKKGFRSIILCPFNELINQYCVDNKSLIPIKNNRTEINAYSSYIMSYDRFNMHYADTITKDDKYLLLIDEVHEMTQGQTYRERFIELQKQILELSDYDNVYTAFISATIDPLTVKLFSTISHKLIFTRKDLREFELQLTDNNLEYIAYTAIKSSWATKVSIYSDFLNAANICSDEEIGYGCSINNDIHGMTSTLPKIKDTGLLTHKINFFTSAGFAGININNQNERFLIVIDYAFLKSCADIKQILGRYRKHNNEFVVYVVLNDRKWMQFAEQGFIDMKEEAAEEQTSSYADKRNFIDAYGTTLDELFSLSRSGSASNELKNSDELEKIARLPKSIINYFAADHIRWNIHVETYEPFLNNLITIMMSYGTVHFSNDIKIGIELTTVTNENKHINSLIDRFLKSKGYDIETIKKTCGMREFNGSECVWNNGWGNALVGLAENVKKITECLEERDYEKFEKMFKDIYGADPETLNTLFKVKKNKELSTTEAYNAGVNKWRCLCTLYLSANNVLCDILYRDDFLSAYSNDVIRLWKYRTERTAAGFMENVKNHLIGYHLSNSDYKKQMERIDRYKKWLGGVIKKFNGRENNKTREYRADYKHICDKEKSIENGRKCRGDLKKLWIMLESEYSYVGSEIIKARKKGGGNGRKKTVCLVVYDNGPSKTLEAESRLKMNELLKEIYVGNVFWSTRELNDFYSGKKEKLRCNFGGFNVFLGQKSDFKLLLD